jgi:uncharacterized protein (TIGR03790 family)
MLWPALVAAEGLDPSRLGVVYNTANPASVRVAAYYAAQRRIPAANLVGLAVPDQPTIGRGELLRLRAALLERLPSQVQSLLLVWSQPYAVECMSVTTAFAAGYQPGFCEPGCGVTTVSPLYDTRGWLPADTTGWLPAMMLPSADEALARAIIDRGVAADGSRPRGGVYLVRTQDTARNVRAATYAGTTASLAGRLRVHEIATPVASTPEPAIAYFTGVARVDEIDRIRFLPGAAADHLTSTAGALSTSHQMLVTEWLHQGATGTYGNVTEPCARLEKFPNPEVLLDHYLRGDTLLEAYWKSVLMPGQGLFVGEPLARPFAPGP